MIRKSDQDLKARWKTRFNRLAPEARDALRAALGELRTDAAVRAKVQIERRKLPLAYYWHCVSVYAGHLRRSVSPGTATRRTAKNKHRGRFIVIDGPDGAGKTGQVLECAQHLRNEGVARVISTREPGGTTLGTELRELLLNHRVEMDAGTEALLMSAARNEHARTVITPGLEQGAWVVCDRYTGSSHAYQGAGAGLGEERVTQLEAWLNAPEPDLTIILDIDEPTAQARLTARGGDQTRFERTDAAYRARVRAAFLAHGHALGERAVVIDAKAQRHSVAQRCREALDPVVEQWRTEACGRRREQQEGNETPRV